MRAKKTLGLPRARDLKSNSLTDLQNFFDLILRELDKQWRLIHGDVATPQLEADGFFYFGNKDTLGSWRIGRIGADWVLQHQTTTLGTWVTVDLAAGT